MNDVDAYANVLERVKERDTLGLEWKRLAEEFVAMDKSIPFETRHRAGLRADAARMEYVEARCTALEAFVLLISRSLEDKAT